MKNKIYKNTEFPRRVKNEKFSEDVIAFYENDVLYISYYNFDTREWNFHYEDGILMDFVWMYKPEELKL